MTRAIGFKGADVYCGIGGSGVFRSTNNGNNWIEVNSGINVSANVSSFISYGPAIFVTTWSDVYYTTNDGANWNTATSNLSQNGYAAFSSAILGTNIYTGSGPGVWRRPISEMIVGINSNGNEIPSAFSLGQNYPNPFNPSTKLKFEIAKTGNVKIVVFDVLGRQMQTLVNEVLQPGTYNTSFDASMLSSGVYFYRMEAGDFTDVKRFVVLK